MLSYSFAQNLWVLLKLDLPKVIAPRKKSTYFFLLFLKLELKGKVRPFLISLRASSGVAAINKYDNELISNQKVK